MLPYQTNTLRGPGGVAIAGVPGQVTILKLAPGTHLRPHTGPKNQRLTLHLGLTVPLGPTIRVGAPGEVREWEEGKVLAFDDSFVHEVRARSLQPSSTHPPSCDELEYIHLKNMRAWPEQSAACMIVSRIFHVSSGWLTHSTAACLPQVWHNGTEPRYVLYVSVWHPDMWQDASARTAASVEALMGRSVAEHKKLCTSIMDGSFKDLQGNNAAMEQGRAQGFIQRLFDSENWLEAELHEFGAIAILLLVPSSAYCVWMILRPVLPDKSRKKD